MVTTLSCCRWGWIQSVSRLHAEIDNTTALEPKRKLTKILYVGRLTEKKGVSYLIQAIPEVKKHYPDIHLTIVGGGELAAELKEETIVSWP